MDIETDSFTFKQDNLVNVPILCKYSELIRIHVIYIINDFCFSGKKCPPHLIKTSRITKQNFDCKLSKGLLHLKPFWNSKNIFYLIQN